MPDTMRDAMQRCAHEQARHDACFIRLIHDRRKEALMPRGACLTLMRDVLFTFYSFPCLRTRHR